MELCCSRFAAGAQAELGKQCRAADILQNTSHKTCEGRQKLRRCGRVQHWNTVVTAQLLICTHFTVSQ